MTTTLLANELASSTSPYLRAHKDDPVAWQEWGPKALEFAASQQRMIFLSSGYSSCHWCHVMQKESFSSKDVADVLNNNFVPIKLDRESRPDIDDIYMNFVTATTGSGGWPLNVFLTPETMKPIFGGTYWPGPGSELAVEPTSADRPFNFLDVLHKMSKVWAQERTRCLSSANEITKQLQDFASEGSRLHQGQTNDSISPDEAEPIDLDLLDDAFEHFKSKFDHENGGFSNAPKFPMPVNLRFLLRLGASIGSANQKTTHTRFGFPAPIPDLLGKKSCLQAASMALTTLLTMSRSALRDHLGHGFHRYSVTTDWNLPHFEKMLCDNAELLAVYCDAWALSRNPEVLGNIYDLVEYMTDPESSIVHAAGGWYSSEDADSPISFDEFSAKKEGAYYIWTAANLRSVLNDRECEILSEHFGVKAEGNIETKYDMHNDMHGQNTLFIKKTPSVLAKEFNLSEEAIINIIKTGKQKLRQHRLEKRAKPAVDTKIIASWNGLAIHGLARAAATLSGIDNKRAAKCCEVARRGLEFVRNQMFNKSTGKLTRIYNPVGSGPQPQCSLAFIDDYAFIIKAAISLYDLTLEKHYLDFAFSLQKTLDQDFYVTNAGGYLQAPKADPITNPKPDQILSIKPGTDNTTPSPNGLVVGNLLYLASYAQSLPDMQEGIVLAKELRIRARTTIDAFAIEMLQHPFLYVTMLGGLVMDQLGIHSLLVPDDMTVEQVQELGLRGFGRTVVRGGPGLKSGEVVICTKENVCRPLQPGDLDGEDL